ncbi:TolB protein [Flavobacteriaceae bacterium MAR_2010_72]|nr:TolB protein [Flavobacteriaceae bacterium MAR_2010_72]
MREIVFILVLVITVSCNTKAKKEIENPYHYKIAYNVLFDEEADNYEVFIMDMDGKNKKNITNLKGVEWTYYANDDEVYYISDKDTLHRNYFLYKMKADGSEKTKISDIRLADSWHSSRKNGSEFIVKPHRSIDTAFYIIDANGKQIQRLQPELDMFSDPLFLPDGKNIVFRGGNKSKRFERGYDDELYIMNADGSNMKQLTHFPENDTLKKWHSYAAGPPRWNSKENFITYQSERNGQYNLFAVTPDGSKNWRLTNNTFSEGWHDWSPDGNYLAIEAFDKEQTQFDIYVMNWETKETTKLTDSTYKYQQAPVFVKVYD